ncbi:TolC family outer membrane protein [Indioceanicola profundi]|uniref:TolC family outer membrane protein n=1 Tax=Indioceanicola profundi TaxID=2220096 RepID=UPI000E6AB162|nr:TolC family outer membrane protein [Indioceanicola profundi]
MDVKSLTKRLRRNLRAGLPVIALAAGLGTTPANAQSLQEALAQAYAQNPTLESQRSQLRATDELVPQARAGYFPVISATGDVSRTWTENTTNNSFTSKSVDLSISQPIYSGGRTTAAVSRAENLVQAQRASLVSTEQSVLLDAATAYLDVVRDQAVLELNINNEQVLRRQLEAAQDRFRVGEITRTDVSQAESRLARASSDRILAEGTLNSSRAVFARLIGVVPGDLSQPQLTLTLPNSLQETIALAEDNNPQVIAARFAQEAAVDSVDQVRGDLLPTVSINGSVGRGWDPGGLNGTRDDASVVARVTIPLYQGGSEYARVREAKHTAAQRRGEVDEAQRAVREGAIRAWEGLVTSRSAIQSRQEQVRAATIALEGVRQEATVGSRTVLDVLDAEQELLNARVELVRSQRDELVAAFQVMNATGQLTAGRLALPVETYNYEAHYEDVRNQLWGTSIDR